MKKLRSILAILHAHRFLYVISLITIVVGTSFSYIVPLVIKTTIDSLLNKIPLNPKNLIERLFIALGGIEFLSPRLFIPAIILLIIIAVQGIFTFLSRITAARASESSIEDLRNTLYVHIQRQPLSYFNHAATGDIIQRCTSDIDTIRLFLETQFVEIGNTCLTITIAVGIMFGINPQLAVVTLPIVPISFFFSYFFFLKVQEVFVLSDESEGRLSEMLSEHLRAIRVVKAFGREVHEIKRFDELNVDFKHTMMRLVDLLAVYWSFSNVFSALQIIVVLTLGTFWAVQGNVTLGTLQVFMAYVWMILWPLRQMGRILVDMGKAFVAVGRINEILAEVPEDMHSDADCPKITGRISFKNVSFTYPPPPHDSAAKPPQTVLDNISFDIYPGEIIGILGPTGSGKSTILHLLAGLYPEYDGEILMDGRELHHLNVWEYRKQLGYVLQEPLLFSGSIKKNIRMGFHTAHFTEVTSAAAQAEVHQSIQEFEMRYHTVVGERGVTLSGGQKQRVAIARALIRGLAVYMFDDSLSALDAETDSKIRNNLIAREGGTTVLIVSHRLSTIAGADRIIVIEQGKVGQIGTHEELRQEDGLYKRLWELQGKTGAHERRECI